MLEKSAAFVIIHRASDWPHPALCFTLTWDKHRAIILDPARKAELGLRKRAEMIGGSRKTRTVALIGLRVFFD